jgi:transcriptional regulator with XRE-family HTH domain
MTSSVFSDAYQKFREILVEARKSRGYTQVELAKLLEKPQSFVSKYESGERRIDIVEFVAICRHLKLNPDLVFKSVSQFLN